jgi:predicted metal-dependent peptidase
MNDHGKIRLFLTRHGMSVIRTTDGFGSFPKIAPDHPTLWVVTPGGLISENFPFDSFARLR